jgi:hypothetical protein
VANETDGVDLLAEPEPDDVEVDEGRDPGLDFNLGDEFRIGADLLKETLRMAGREAIRVRAGGPGGGGHRDRGRSRQVRITIDADDDPRQVLTVTEFETFSRRHDDWSPGTPLSPSQVETVRDLLFERANRPANRTEPESEEQ